MQMPLEETRSLVLLSSPLKVRARVNNQTYQRAFLQCTPIDDTHQLVVQCFVDQLRTLLSIDIREVETVSMRNRALRHFSIVYRSGMGDSVSIDFEAYQAVGEDPLYFDNYLQALQDIH